MKNIVKMLIPSRLSALTQHVIAWNINFSNRIKGQRHLNASTQGIKKGSGLKTVVLTEKDIAEQLHLGTATNINLPIEI